MTFDPERLRELDEAATPGEWRFDGNCAGYVRITDGPGEPAIARAYSDGDADLIAYLCSESRRKAILAQSARIAELEAALQEMVETGGDEMLRAEMAAKFIMRGFNGVPNDALRECVRSIARALLSPAKGEGE